MAPDSEFFMGTLGRLVVGNEGRMMDPRRTPIRIVDVLADVAMFELEVTAFEDADALWRLPMEKVESFQFALDSKEATPTQVGAYETAVARFDQPLVINAGPSVAKASEERIASQVSHARDWLKHHSMFFEAGRTLELDGREGDRLLCVDLTRYLDSLGVADIESDFATTYVSNPGSGEIVKGHCIVLAELGLVPYRGKIVRDPATFFGEWSKEHRAQHVVARLGFLRAAFGLAGHDHVVLYRSLSFPGDPPASRDASLISTTFSRLVAEAWLDADADRYSVVLMRQPIPVERLFMTFVETKAMNQQFGEAEAVLLADPDNQLF